jgi:hypothetical protein
MAWGGTGNFRLVLFLLFLYNEGMKGGRVWGDLDLYMISWISRF